MSSTPSTPPTSSDPCGPAVRGFAPVRSIVIRTAIPGPKSRAIFAANPTAGFLDSANGEIIVSHAHGARVTDVDGNVYIDFGSGDSAIGSGYTLEPALALMQEQTERLDSLPALNGLTTANHVELATLIHHLTGLGADYCTILTRQIADPLPNWDRVGIWQMGQLISAERLAAQIQATHTAGRWLALDEHSGGVGRTGTLFAAQQHPEHLAACDAHIVAFDGIRAVTCRRELAAHFLRHEPAVDVVAVIRTLGALRFVVEQALPRRAIQLGDLVTERVATWAQQTRIVERVGIASAQILRFASPAFVAHLIQLARENGVLLRPNRDRSGVPLLYPLMIPEEQFHEGLDVIESLLPDLNDLLDVKT